MNRFRKYLAGTLVRVAQRIHPESKEVKQFYERILFDQLITGQSVVRIDPKTMYKEDHV